MFTGLISDIGTLLDVQPRAEGVRLKIKCSYLEDTINIGASIACAGVCLTVIERGHYEDGCYFIVEAWKEALLLTTIGKWQIGQKINLERSLTLGDELGGHLVSGHIDGKASIVDISNEGAAKRVVFTTDRKLARFIAPKGSVALDGTSLTVNNVQDTQFDVLLIDHTLKVTTWKDAKIGQEVNLEVDQMARYAARLMTYGDTGIK